MKIIWLPRAISNRDDQLNYVALESPQSALELGDRIEQNVPMLAEFPDMGRSGRERGTRELVISQTLFIVVYRVKKQLQLVEVLRLLHGAQQYPKKQP